MKLYLPSYKVGNKTEELKKWIAEHNRKICLIPNSRDIYTRGITLIVLIVTIIILLILAGVTIALFIGENGILEKATFSKDLTEEKKEEETVKLADYENKIDKYMDSEYIDSETKEQITIDKEEYENMKKQLEDLLQKNTNIELISTGLVSDNNKTSYKYNATKDGKVMITLFTARGDGGQLAQQFYCKKNNTNVSAKNTIGSTYRRMSYFVVDVIEGDVIELCAQSSGAWGDSGYTISFVE